MTSLVVLFDFCGSEKEKVRSCREKISKWQNQVSERLLALGKRTGDKFDSFLVY